MTGWIELTLQLTAATMIGGAIGLNRDLHHKPTGLRTMALVGLGSALIVQAATAGYAGALDLNPVSRVIQGVITGVGFLGAGVILRQPGIDKIHGLTTAASIWLTAGLGVLSGLGAWRPLLIALALAWFVLLLGGKIEHWFHRRFSKKTEENEN